jgi:arsenate reductase
MKKNGRKRVVFLCTGNSARSQMAEGLMRSLRGDEFDVCSAGSEPKGVHPLAIKVMKEIGTDVSPQTSKHLNIYLNEKFDYVVTLCDHANETCPLFSGAGKKIHQGFSDPAAIDGTEEEKLEMFRKIRDRLRTFILSFPPQPDNYSPDKK